MPAVSDKQRKMMAIAEHQPGKLYAKNKGVLKMKKSQLHDFAATKGLKKKGKGKKSSTSYSDKIGSMGGKKMKGSNKKSSKKKGY